MQNSSRVVARQGARELTPEEVEKVTGRGPFHTAETLPNPAAPHGDGDFRE
jgi:hypothetical protein